MCFLELQKLEHYSLPLQSWEARLLFIITLIVFLWKKKGIYNYRLAWGWVNYVTILIFWRTIPLINTMIVYAYWILNQCFKYAIIKYKFLSPSCCSLAHWTRARSQLMQANSYCNMGCGRAVIVCNGNCVIWSVNGHLCERMALLKNAERKSDRRQGTRNGPDVYRTANRGGKLASENRSNEAWRSLSSRSLAVNEALLQSRGSGAQEDEWIKRPTGRQGENMEWASAGTRHKCVCLATMFALMVDSCEKLSPLNLQKGQLMYMRAFYVMALTGEMRLTCGRKHERSIRTHIKA